MTNTKLLRKYINASGYKLQYIAKQLDITYAGLLKKINNETEFKASEIQILCDLLNINVEDRENIFFAPVVDKISTN